MSTAGDIERMTEKLGGTFTRFNQSWDGIKGVRQTPGLYTNEKKHSWWQFGSRKKLYVGGMCHIMSAYWIVGRASGLGEARTGFIEWVVPGGDKSAVNLGAVAVLVSKTVMYKARGSAAERQGIVSDPLFDEHFFALHRIGSANETFDGFDAVKEGISRSRRRYYMIGYSGPDSAHANAAARMPGGTFAYFDPNYGEAVITSGSSDFRTWYRRFLRITGYRTKYTEAASATAFKSQASP